MCRAVACTECGKTTWAGCGNHIEQVQASVEPDQWCAGHDSAATTVRHTTIDKSVFALTGTLTLVGTALGLLWSPWWFALTVFVGVMQLQTAFTRFCPAALFLSLALRRPTSCATTGTQRSELDSRA